MIFTLPYLIKVFQALFIVFSTWIIGIVLKKLDVMYKHVLHIPLLLKNNEELKKEMAEIREELKSKATHTDLELHKKENLLAIEQLKNFFFVNKEKKS